MTEPVSRACPQCDTELSVPRERLGKRVRCPDCGHVFTPEKSPPPVPSDRTQQSTAERVDNAVADAVFAIWQMVVGLFAVGAILQGLIESDFPGAAIGFVLLQSISILAVLREIRDR